MGSQADQGDKLNLNDELGEMIHRSLESRVGRAQPPARGREQLLAEARTIQVDRDHHHNPARDDFHWRPLRHRDESHIDRDVFGGLIHATDSIRKMSL